MDRDRKLPAPWAAVEIPGGYKIADANGQTLAYVYGREKMDEARRVAANLAKLPELLAARKE